jgi:hypothetical protein
MSIFEMPNTGLLGENVKAAKAVGGDAKTVLPYDFMRFAFADWAHDSYPLWRNEEKADKDKKDIRKYLLDFFKKYDMEDLFTSGVEHKIMSEFEDAQKIESVKSVITYQDILTKSKDPAYDPFTDIKTNILIIEQDSKLDIDKCSQADKTTIANFILKYLFKTSEGYTPKFTFDAGQATIGKIFRGHQNAIGLIIPQNVSDSAVTSLQKLGALPNEYKFPDISRQINSIINLCPGYDIEFENHEFSETNPYGFSLTFTIKGADKLDPAKKLDFTFGKGRQQGPSLDYLLNMILMVMSSKKRADVKFKDIPVESSFVPVGIEIDEHASIEGDIIDKIKGHLEILPAELKGGGDRYQGYGASILGQLEGYEHIVYVSGDRLSCLLLRLLGKSNIYQYHQTLTICRSKNIPNLSAEDAAAHAVLQKKLFTEYNTQFFNEFTDDSFIIKLTAFRDSIPKFEDDAQPTFGKKLLQVVSFMIYYQFMYIDELLSDFIKRYKSEIERIKGGAIEIENIQAISNIFTETLGINTSDFNELQKYISAPFDFKRDYKLFQYSLKVYTRLSSAAVALNAKITSNKPDRVAINYYELANQTDGYNSSIREILESMPNMYYKEEVDEEVDEEGIVLPNLEKFILNDTDITKDAVSTKIKGFIAVAGGGRKSRAKAVVKAASAKAAARAAAAAAEVKKAKIMEEAWGAEWKVALKDAMAPVDEFPQSDFIKADIFRDVCSIASLFLKSIFPILENFPEFPEGDDDTNIQRFVQTIENLYIYFESKIEEYDIRSDNTISMIRTLINPFSEDGTLKGGHPLNKWPAIKKSFRPQYVNYPEIPALLTLAIMNDLFEGALERETSLFIKGDKFPESFKELHAKVYAKAGWRDVERQLETIFISIMIGKLHREVLGLLGGRRRITRKRRAADVKRRTLKSRR